MKDSQLFLFVGSIFAVPTVLFREAGFVTYRPFLIIALAALLIAIFFLIIEKDTPSVPNTYTKKRGSRSDAKK